jgi:cation diffusion facilitator CzcD-associated flavoprotein CzcO
LSDIVVKAAAERIEPIFAEDSNESDPTRPVEYFKIHLSCRDAIYARKVVVASGLTQANNPDWTKAIEPSSYPANTLTHSDYVRLSGPNKIEVKSKRVLIVGSGLSSGHLVLCAQKLGCAKVVLASRKLLQSKQFDIGLEWVGRYKSNHLNAFWDLDMQGRFNMIKDARGGGTLAPDVLAAVRASAKSHPNQVQVREEVQVTSSKWIPDPVTLAKGMGHWEVSFTDGRTEQFDFIWLATGRRRDVASEPIFKDIIEHCPIPLVNGLPCVDIGTKRIYL